MLLRGRGFSVSSQLIEFFDQVFRVDPFSGHLLLQGFSRGEITIPVKGAYGLCRNEHTYDLPMPGDLDRGSGIGVVGQVFPELSNTYSWHDDLLVYLQCTQCPEDSGGFVLRPSPTVRFGEYRRGMERHDGSD